jgi:hypothetical protein
MEVVVWNMQHNEGNWGLLRRGGELAADLHLLCEAPKRPRDIVAIGQWRTVGLADALPLDRPVTREWSTAVAADSGPTFITDARRTREYRDRPSLPFKPSRPGTWIAARVKLGRLTVTAVALYGLLDEMSDASMHRSLSELAPIFDHRVYRKYVLLGGDFNIFANPRRDDRARERHRSVLMRLEAYGLTNCLDGFPRPAREAREDPCPCGAKHCRQHWRTFRRSPSAPGRAYQEDYLFISEAMAKFPRECSVLAFQPTSHHAPVRAVFDV